MKKRKYTTKIHAERVKRMMKKKSPCGLCPATPYFNDGENPEEFWSGSITDICAVCREFIWLTDTSGVVERGVNKMCPCHTLKPEEALRRTRKALKEWERAMKRKEE